MHLHLTAPRQPTALLRTYRDDPRRSFLVNGNAYRREMNRHKSEPHTSLPQAVIGGLALAVFVLGVLLVAAGLSS